jgi:acetyl esterase/lipase
VIVERAIVYAEKEGYRALALDVYRPEGAAAQPRPVVLNVHGGGWRVSGRHRTPRETRSWPEGFFGRIVDAGFVVVSCDYRFSGEALWPAAVDDVKDALRWVQANIAEHGGDPSRVALWGQSAGGYLAAAVGLAADVPAMAGVVCWYPITDFTALDQDDATSYPALFLGGALRTVADVARAASTLALARPDAPPFLLIHGTADTMAPYDQSVRLRDALVAARARVDLHTVDGADHFFGGHDDVEGLFTRSIEFLRGATS